MGYNDSSMLFLGNILDICCSASITCYVSAKMKIKNDKMKLLMFQGHVEAHVENQTCL